MHGRCRNIPTSPILEQYQYMKGVDNGIPIRGYIQHNNLPILRWWPRPSFWIINKSLVHLFLFYDVYMRDRGLKPLSHLMYQLQVVKALTKYMVGLCDTRANY